MGKIGFLVGLGIGFMTRDQFNLTMAEKMNYLTDDYKRINSDINEKIRHNERHIQIMKYRESQL